MTATDVCIKKNPAIEFQSLEAFKDYIRKSFIKGSGIDPIIFDACVEFHETLEYGDGGEVSTPIHEELNWHFARFGKIQKPMYAAFLRNEDGSLWQAIISSTDDNSNRPYRYLAPKSEENGDRAYLPPIPLEIRRRISQKYGIEVPEEGSFWEWLEDANIPRIVTEGGKKSLSALSQGYAAISLFGCTCGVKVDEQDETYLIEDLRRFATEESTWLFAFDRDEKEKAKISVARGKKKFRLALTEAKCMHGDIYWKSERGKGMDDLIANGGGGAFDDAYQQAIAKLQKAYDSDSVFMPKQSRSKHMQRYNLLKSRWGDELKFNEMQLCPERKGKPLDLDTLSIQIAMDFDIDIGRDSAIELVTYIAKEKSYHPVRSYLKEVSEAHPNQDMRILDNLASRYFGTTEPLYNTFMRKTLIGLVRRVMEPGCQFDSVCVLQGGQGIRKSTFWKTLAVNPNWFDGNAGTEKNDKDELLKLRRFWILELAEIEAVFKKKEVASLRAFLTNKDDSLRPPYGRKMESFPRTSGFVGSVNPAEFLVDPEGHRRNWVIPVGLKRIPIEKLEAERDRLWAAAVQAYKMGEKHYLDSEDEEKNAFLNKRYETTDSWTEVIAFYLENKHLTETTTTEVMSDCLNLEVGRHDKSSQMRVATILRKLGWVKAEKATFNGKKSTPIWKKTVDTSSNLEVSTAVLGVASTEVSTTSNTYSEGILADALTPSQNDPAQLEKEKFCYSGLQGTQALQEKPESKLPAPIEVEIQGLGGKSRATLIVTKVHSTGKSFKVECELADGTKKTLHQKQKLTGSKAQAEQEAREILEKYQGEVLATQTFKVRKLWDEEYVWVEGCKVVSLPNPPVKTYYLFRTAEGTCITAGDGEFRLM
ncbi:MAG: DUF3854 domain-containing protein [Cyanomargarita calcarea GSE-NOS-MK-12-04C]|jgi:predicted P-loop ATPase|uniref:DUF3854 domain-containing protein n=1 Tax=Cyanomargarita calcarea GSE-NOS-MK-12-04C TaxID=2839659 RepID=A0A951QJH5_9CYAN|nr:DUF3854 domain-containing protein [Cyanomargarita calcarea GSE-NOS-MK-12-04C]